MVYIKGNSKQAKLLAWLHNDMPEKIKGQLFCELQLPQQDRAGKEFLYLQVQGIGLGLLYLFSFIVLARYCSAPIVQRKWNKLN